MAIEEFGGDPIQAHFDALHAMHLKGIHDPRAEDRHLTAIELGWARQQRLYAEIDRPATPDDLRLLRGLASDLGFRVSLPDKMTHGQAVAETGRLNRLVLRQLAQQKKRNYRQAVAPIRGGAA